MGIWAFRANAGTARATRYPDERLTPALERFDKSSSDSMRDYMRGDSTIPSGSHRRLLPVGALSATRMLACRDVQYVISSDNSQTTIGAPAPSIALTLVSRAPGLRPSPAYEGGAGCTPAVSKFRSTTLIGP